MKVQCSDRPVFADRHRGGDIFHMQYLLMVTIATVPKPKARLQCCKSFAWIQPLFAVVPCRIGWVLC